MNYLPKGSCFRSFRSFYRLITNLRANCSSPIETLLFDYRIFIELENGIHDQFKYFPCLYFRTWPFEFLHEKFHGIKGES